MALSGTPKRSGESNSQYAYRVLRANIMNYTLAPGSPLNEGALSEEMGISRTPMREAFIRLKEERLIDIFPQKLSRVALIDLSLVAEGYFMRTTLEPFALERVCGSLPGEYIGKLGENLAYQKSIAYGTKHVDQFFLLDNEFHNLLYRAAQLPTVWHMILTIASNYERVRYFDSLFGGDRLATLHDEHDSIFSAILKGDRENLATLAREHVSVHQDVMPRALKKYPQYFKADAFEYENTREPLH